MPVDCTIALMCTYVSLTSSGIIVKPVIIVAFAQRLAIRRTVEEGLERAALIQSSTLCDVGLHHAQLAPERAQTLAEQTPSYSCGLS